MAIWMLSNYAKLKISKSLGASRSLHLLLPATQVLNDTEYCSGNRAWLVGIWFSICTVEPTKSVTVI